MRQNYAEDADGVKPGVFTGGGLSRKEPKTISARRIHKPLAHGSCPKARVPASRRLKPGKPGPRAGSEARHLYL